MDLLTNTTSTNLLPSNVEASIPDPHHQFQANYHYYNLNSQLKFDLEQQNAIKLQQLEAIKLIQISLDKLTATTTVPLHNNSSKLANNTTTPTILVYKETNLHKNLLVSKILNKAKYVYYQSIVQTMRLSLMSKLNYYSSLIQQLNATATTTTKLNSSTKLDDSIANNETNLVDEMKVLMQQILHETYQFNLNTPFNNNIDRIDLMQPQTAPVVHNKPPLTPSSQLDANDVESSEQMKRIKQLNDVKLSLYSLLFPSANVVTPTTQTTASTPLSNINNLSDNEFKFNKKSDENAKRKRHHHNHHHHHSTDQELNDNATKRHKKFNQSIDLNNNHIVILSDDTNYHNHRKSIKRNKSPQQHISSRLLKTTLDAVVNSTNLNTTSNSTATQIDSVVVN